MAHKEKLKTKRSRRKKSFSKLYLVLFVFALSAGSFWALIHFSGRYTPARAVSAKEQKNIVYVRQFSDSNITENAKVVDKQLKNLTFSKNTSLVGNVISSLKKDEHMSTRNSEESGSWLWTPILQITPDYRNKIISDAKKEGIRNIYLSIDSYLDIAALPESVEKIEKKAKFDKIVYDFIKLANENNITVDAEAGWRNWAEQGSSYKAFATVSYAIDFNNKNDVKFRGFQYDIEPYLLDYYKENKKAVLGNYINLLDETVAKLDGSSLLFSVAVPEFYDGSADETPKVFYAGQELFPFEQILRVLDKREGSSIIIMSYRNFSQGKDGVIDISSNEISLSSKYNTKIILALETGKVEPSYITFYNTKKSYYDKQVSYIINAFIDSKNFGGIATHYINTIGELQ